MNSNVQYRYNVMKIDSLQSFINIKGSYINNVKDVFFVEVRSDKYNSIIEFLEKTLPANLKMQSNVTIRYAKELKNVNNNDINTYIGKYEEKKCHGKITLENVTGEFLECFNLAYDNIIEFYKKGKNSVSETMIKNFSIKLLSWIYGIGMDIFEKWSPKSVTKIFIKNIDKEQEYLFAYFLTLLGCDVMIINEETKTGLNKLESYIRCLNDIKLDLVIPTPATPNRVPVNQTTPNGVLATPASNNSVPIKPASIKVASIKQEPVTQRIEPNRELSFEELAQLSSSVVMIFVQDRNYEVLGTGSGIMIGRDGYIITNFHVIEGGSHFVVRIENDDNEYQTDEVVKYNNLLDLAIIRIGKMLKPLPIYSSNKPLVRGQQIVTIGSPLGLFNSFSNGIISGIRKTEEQSLIQFTAPISYGSSGGALLNMKGEIIGVTQSGMEHGQNMSFAIGYEVLRMFTKGFVS